MEKLTLPPSIVRPSPQSAVKHTVTASSPVHAVAARSWRSDHWRPDNSPNSQHLKPKHQHESMKRFRLGALDLSLSLFRFLSLSLPPSPTGMSLNRAAAWRREVENVPSCPMGDTFKQRPLRQALWRSKSVGLSASQNSIAKVRNCWVATPFGLPVDPEVYSMEAISFRSPWHLLSRSILGAVT